jgi:hypothetical protein
MRTVIMISLYKAIVRYINAAAAQIESDTDNHESEQLEGVFGFQVDYPDEHE